MNDTDVERFQQWMTDNGHTMKSLAKAMDVRYITIYHMTVKRKAISDRFITRFIQHFGCEEAVKVFAAHLTTTA